MPYKLYRRRAIFYKKAINTFLNLKMENKNKIIHPISRVSAPIYVYDVYVNWLIEFIKLFNFLFYFTLFNQYIMSSYRNHASS